MLLKKDLAYYQSLEYRVIVEPVIDEFGKEYIAYAEELGKYSCFGKGDTPQDAISNFLKEKDDFIEFLHNKGKPIPEPAQNKEEELPNGVIVVRTSPILHRSLIMQAKSNKLSLNQYINHLLSTASAVEEVKSHFDEQFSLFCDQIESSYKKSKVDNEGSGL